MKSQNLVQYTFLLVVSICTLFLFNADIPSNQRMLRADLRAATAMQLHKQFLNMIPDNQAPIIGIMTQGTTDMAYYDDYTMIASSYIKYIEAAGGKVVAVPYNVDEEALGRIYENINGLLVPGGRMKLVLPTRDSKEDDSPELQMSMLARAIKYFVNRSVDDFHKGVYFPIFGICLGQEAIALALNEDVLQTMTLLDLEENTYVNGAGSFTKESAKVNTTSYCKLNLIREPKKADYSSPSLMMSSSPLEMEQDSTTITSMVLLKKHTRVNNAPIFLVLMIILDSDILSKFMMPLTTLEDKSNRKYITSYEVSNYPLFGVQFHPEKTSL